MQQCFAVLTAFPRAAAHHQAGAPALLKLNPATHGLVQPSLRETQACPQQNPRTSRPYRLELLGPRKQIGLCCTSRYVAQHDAARPQQVRSISVESNWCPQSNSALTTLRPQRAERGGRAGRGGPLWCTRPARRTAPPDVCVQTRTDLLSACARKAYVLSCITADPPFLADRALVARTRARSLSPHRHAPAKNKEPDSRSLRSLRSPEDASPSASARRHELTRPAKIVRISL